MCFVNMALVVSTSPVPQQRPQHHQQRRPSGPFSFLENFFNSTMRFFSNSTFGSSSTNNRQSALSYEGDHLPTDAQIQNGLFALQNYRKGATAGQ